MRRDFALPGTRARYTPDRTCDIQHIKLAIDVDVDKREIRGVCSLTLQPIGRRPRTVILDAVELTIHGISSAEQAVPFEHDGQRITIDVRLLEADPETPFALDIEYSGAPRRGLYFVGPDEGHPDKPTQVWTQGQDVDSRYWFPCFDSPNEKATSELVATVPGHFTTLSNGALVSDRLHADGRRTMHWRFDKPHACYLITLVAGEFSITCESWTSPDGRDVEVSCYVTPGREREAEMSVRGTSAMLTLFSRLFGPYPYDKYAQVFVADFIFGGMENTTATTLTDVLLVDKRAHGEFPVDRIVAHELAHQWFGDLLTCREWGQGWLNEGFATYAEYLWREHADSRDEADVELDEWISSYLAEDRERYRRPIATRVYDEPIEIFDNHLYQKGGRVLHMLRQVLGDEPFFAAIARYVANHRFGSVDTRDLVLAVEQATGRALDWFFEQWVTEGAGHPELTVRYEWNLELGLACIKVSQDQEVADKTPLFRLPVKVRFRVQGRDFDVDLTITEKRHVFHVALADKPEHVIFDPGQTLIAQVKTEMSTELFVAQLRDATLAIDRVHAARQLARRGGRSAAEALARALGDPFWSVRAAAAHGLGALTTEGARSALIAAVSSTWHPKARRAVVQALGEWRRDERVAETLAEIVRTGDASYYVEAEACLSLGKTRSPQAGPCLRMALERDSFMDIIRQKAYAGLAEARDDSAIPLLQDATAYGRPAHGRRAALVALARLTAGRRDRDARDVRELAEELLFDREFRVQFGAIDALESIGDTASVVALRRFATRELDARLRRRAREVLRDLQSGAGPQAQLDALRDEVERLRKTTEELRGQLDKLLASGAPGLQSGKDKRGKDKRGKSQNRENRPGKNRPGKKERGKDKNGKKSRKKGRQDHGIIGRDPSSTRVENTAPASSDEGSGSGSGQNET